MNFNDKIKLTEQELDEVLSLNNGRNCLFLFDNFDCTTEYTDEIKYIIKKQKWPEASVIVAIKTKFLTESKRLCKETVIECVNNNSFLFNSKYWSNFILSGFNHIDVFFNAKIFEAETTSILEDLNVLNPDIFKINYQQPLLTFILIAYVHKQRKNRSSLDPSLFEAFNAACERF